MDRQHRLYASSIGFSLVTIMGLLQLLQRGSPPSDYTLTTWKWDYSLGPIRRGLLGTVVRALGYTPVPMEVFRIGLAVFVGCLVLYGLLAAVAAYQRPSVKTLMAALSGVLLQPALPSLVTSLGRLDHVGFAVLLICSMLICVGDSILIALVISMLCSVVVMVHEGYAIMHMPLVCSLFWASCRVRGVVRPTVRMSVVVAFPLTTLVWLMGLRAPLAYPDWLAYWSARSPVIADPPAETETVYRIHFLTIADNFCWAVSFATAHRFSFLFAVVVALMVLVAAVVIGMSTVRHSLRPWAWSLGSVRI